MQGLVGFPVDCTFYFIIFEVNLLYNIALVSMKLEMPSHLLHLDYFVCSKIEIAEHQEIDTIQGSHSLSFQSLLNNIKYYPGITYTAPQKAEFFNCLNRPKGLTRHEANAGVFACSLQPCLAETSG